MHDLFAHARGSEQARQQPPLVAGYRGGLKNARGEIDRAKQTVRIFGRLRSAEEQIAGGIERVVEGAAYLLLQLAIEIDEDVAAGDQVDVRERRILEQVVHREQHQIANLLPHLVMIAFAREEAAQAFLAHVGLDGGRIAALARRRERPGIEIGAEHLNRWPQRVARCLL